jgi:hypothetical protein
LAKRESILRSSRESPALRPYQRGHILNFQVIFCPNLMRNTDDSALFYHEQDSIRKGHPYVHGQVELVNLTLFLTFYNILVSPTNRFPKALGTEGPKTR